MLVIVGANGRTGVELVRQALQRGLDVRAVVRDDRDADKLNDVIPVGQMPEILSMIQVNKMTPAPAVLVVVSLLRIKVSPRVILFLFIEIFPQKSRKRTDNNPSSN